MEEHWKVLVHREVKKKQIPLLEQAGLKVDYEEIIKILKLNPFSNERSREEMSPKQKELYSVRINGRHRVVYTVDKETKTVKLWSAWSHYEKNIPK